MRSACVGEAEVYFSAVVFLVLSPPRPVCFVKDAVCVYLCSIDFSSLCVHVCSFPPPHAPRLLLPNVRIVSLSFINLALFFFFFNPEV